MTPRENPWPSCPASGQAVKPGFTAALQHRALPLNATTGPSFRARRVFPEFLRIFYGLNRRPTLYSFSGGKTPGKGGRNFYGLFMPLARWKRKFRGPIVGSGTAFCRRPPPLSSIMTIVSVHGFPVRRPKPIRTPFFSWHPLCFLKFARRLGKV